MKFVLLGPTYPFRGGIAHHTTRLYNALSRQHSTTFLTFQRQYPKWLFPGKTDRDPSNPPLENTVLPVLDPLNPITWMNTVHRIQMEKPDALILPWWESFWGPAFALITFLVKRSGIRVIFVCHNIMPHESRPGAITLSRLALRQGDGFVIQSVDDGAHITEWMPHAHVQYVPHPIYVGAMVSVPHRYQQSIAELLFFGFVRPYKGLRVLLNAVAIVTKQRSVHLTVAGEFWEKRQDYERLIQSLGIENSVMLVDRYLTNRELDALFAQSDLAVFPYLSATSSAALGLAVGHGVPVVVSNVGDLGRMVTENTIGQAANPGDENDLAHKILKCLEPDALSSYRLNAARMRASAETSWQSLVRAIQALSTS